MVVNYTTDAIIADEWGVLETYMHFLNGTLTFDELIRQQNESRLFFPKLIFIGMAALNNFHYNTYHECLLIFAVACFISINIFILSRFTLLLALWQYLFLAEIANLLIFSPISWDNWGWGIQLIVFIPIACITTALVLTKLNLKLPLVALLTALLGTFSTYSFSNGILYWVVIFPALVAARVSNFDQIKTVILSRWRTLSLWVTFAAINIAYFFYNYKKPSYHSSLLEALKNLFDAVLYFLAFLGAPLASANLLVAQGFGTVFLGCCIWVCFRVWRLRFQSGFLQVVYPWLCIGTYTLLSAALAALGRSSLGVSQALTYRYNTFSVYGWVALLYLITALWRHDPILVVNKAKHDRSRRTQLFRIFAVSLLVTTLIMQNFSWSHGLDMMKAEYRNRLYGKACLLSKEIVLEADCIARYVFPIVKYLETRPQELDSLGGWEPGLISMQDVNEAVTAQAPGSTFHGHVDTATSQEVGGFFKFWGWAILPEYKYPAHGVMLVALDAQGKATPIAIAPVNQERPDVKQAINTSDYRSQRFGWEMILPKERVPVGATQVIALAIDTNTGDLHRLVGSSQLQR
ncbi:MAG TPA: hypothetical protein IGS53_04160 [Leptolyngbyaceae cyanobacterium M33_DOE_097]|uniref:Uncharacterized protein n=1 Tax=Oscillatoriales cyanobacterium SpSt-418 TaxID=2282169 RepID=A0A7C3PHS6_9CYAN|nr:hypothetical protein [Leptolyngbyaceae cyanobacterium M33_DOE_097]